MTSMITEARPIAFQDALPEAVDVLVVGGGVAGVASAYFLAKQGASVLVCEKGRIAGEQSSRNWGWVRQQGRDPAELPIMIEANRIWRGLEAETGEADLKFTQAGCLYLAKDAAQMAKYETWRDVAMAHQLDTRMLTAEEAKAMAPAMAGDWAGGMITPSDGRAEPFVAVPALARAAQRASALVREATAVRTLEVEGGRVVGTVTEAGRVRAGAVLVAGGAWSTFFAGNAGLDLPQLAVRSTVMRTEAAPDVIGPNVSSPGLAIRRRADGGYSVTSADLAEHYLSPKSFRYFTKYLKLMKLSAKDVRIRLAAPKGYPGSWGQKRRWGPNEASPFEAMRVVNPAPSPIVVERVKERLGERVPELKGVGIAEAWGGMIDVTPDAVPYLAEDHRRPGLFYATGLSGHGFGIGPGVGRAMADLILGRTVGHDLSRFRTNRFSDGSEIVPGPY